MRFSKHLLCTLVVAGLVGVLAVPAGARPTPVSKARAAGLKPVPSGATDQVFDLRGLPADKRDITKAAIENHDFDWTKLLPRLRKDGARKRITITVTDTSAWGAVGLAWPAPIGKIEIDDDDVKNPSWFRDVVLHELGHMVDFYYLDPNGLQKDVAALYGRPWEEAGHPFNAAFTQAFSIYQAQDKELPLAASSHHDYPAWDLGVPIGTEVYSVTDGRVVGTTERGRCGIGVIIEGWDGLSYLYCHGSELLVRPRQRVAAGDPIMLSGNTGRSTGPHLHLQVRLASGALVCPQEAMVSWFGGGALSLAEGGTDCWYATPDGEDEIDADKKKRKKAKRMMKARKAAKAEARAEKAEAKKASKKKKAKNSDASAGKPVANPQPSSPTSSKPMPSSPPPGKGTVPATPEVPEPTNDGRTVDASPGTAGAGSEVAGSPPNL
jgi:hypothetical protein